MDIEHKVAVECEVDLDCGGVDAEVDKTKVDGVMDDCPVGGSKFLLLDGGVFSSD